MTTANSMAIKSTLVKPKILLLAIAVAVVLALVAAPSPAFAAKMGTIPDFYPPDNNSNSPVTVVLIEVEGEQAPYVFVTDEPVDLEEGQAVTFTEGPGRTASDVEPTGNVVNP